MRIDTLGVVTVSGGGAIVAGHALGGRRARVALVVLALSGQPVSAQRLASIIWADGLPATWQIALRGVIRGLRLALAPVGGGQAVIITAPSAYRLAPEIEVDVTVAQQAVRRAVELLGQGRALAALELAQPVAAHTGEQLLPGEDSPWLEPHRQALDAMALRAMGIVADAAGRLGEHQTAVAAARRAVSLDPLDERAHRTLIHALGTAGDRSGAVRAYEHCRAAIAEQLGLDPSAETVQEYLAALGDLGATSPARLPTAVSTFVGREPEAARLDAALGTPGLVTVAGPGGVGKSRLASWVAATRRDFPGGRLWVPLALVAEDALVASSVAIEVGAPAGADDPASALAAYLAPRGRTLLILDGCEAVIDGVASLAAAVLTQCPLLTLVVTSRIPLDLDGERVLRIGPLSAPAAADAAALRASAQVRLLVDRVRAGGGDLRVDDRLAPHVAHLLHTCGGLPLTLELVAAQLAAMPVGDLLDHLGDFLAGGDDRLRAVALSSYTLLDADEAAVFRHFAVLDGPVGLPLVRRVVSGGPIGPVRVVRILRELTARGLLTVDRSGVRWRYQQDDDLHRFARELLVEHGEERAAFDRLADAVHALLPSDARESPAGFQDEVTDVLGSIRSLFRAAMAGRADRDRCLELAFRLHRYWAGTNVAEGRFWLARMLDGQPPGPWTPYATFALGYLDYWSGDAENAITELQDAIRMLDGVEDPYPARALIYLAGLFDDLDRGAEAVQCVRRAIGAARPFGTDLQVAAAMGLGSVLSERGAPEAAGYAADAIGLCRAGGSPEQLAATLPTAAMVCWQVGALDQARAYVAEARPLHTGGRRIARVVLLSVSAALALADEDLDAAVDLGTDADREAAELGVEREIPLIRSLLAQAQLARGHPAAAARWAAAAIDGAVAVAYAYPLALGLETAALVLDAAAAAGHDDVTRLLSAAAVIRARGDRPTPVMLAGPVAALRDRLGPGPPPTTDDAHLDKLGEIAAYGQSLLSAVHGTE